MIFDVALGRFPGGIGGTGGTPRDSARPCGTGAWDRWNRAARIKISPRGSTSHTISPTKIDKTAGTFHQFHQFHGRHGKATTWCRNENRN